MLLLPKPRNTESVKNTAATISHVALKTPMQKKVVFFLSPSTQRTNGTCYAYPN